MFFKKHSPNEAEELFICGTNKTTPPLENISDEWSKPWLYSRVAIILFTTFYLFLLCWTGFSNTNVIPDIIFVGAGFAAFESAVYAFRNVFPSLNVDSMVDSIYLRGFLAPGGHVAWAAITGAAIMVVLKKVFSLGCSPQQKIYMLA